MLSYPSRLQRRCLVSQPSSLPLRPCPHSSSLVWPRLSSLSLWLWCICKNLSFCLIISFARFNSMWALAFLTSFLHAPTVSQVTCPCFHLLSAPFLKLSFASSSLFIHVGSLSFFFLLVFLESWVSWVWTRWSLKISRCPGPFCCSVQDIMGFSQTVPRVHRILLSWSSEFWWSNWFSLGSSQNPGHQHVMVMQSRLPSPHIPTISSFFISIKSSSVPFPIRSWGICLQQLPSIHSWIACDLLGCPFSRYQSGWISPWRLRRVNGGSCPEGGLICLFLIWQAADTCYSITYLQLIANPGPSSGKLPFLAFPCSCMPTSHLCDSSIISTW